MKIKGKCNCETFFYSKSAPELIIVSEKPVSRGVWQCREQLTRNTNTFLLITNGTCSTKDASNNKMFHNSFSFIFNLCHYSVWHSFEKKLEACTYRDSNLQPLAREVSTLPSSPLGRLNVKNILPDIRCYANFVPWLF